MERRILEDRLCREFCSFYKPTRDQDLSCRGFLVAERLIACGRELPFHAEKKRSGAGTEALLREKLCVCCPFVVQDCDFAGQREDAPPCGGFLFLSRSIEDGALSVDDIPETL